MNEEQEQNRTSEGVVRVVSYNGATSKIYDPHSRTLRGGLDQDVFQFQIPMEDFPGVHVYGCLHQLLHDDLNQRYRDTEELEW